MPTAPTSEPSSLSQGAIRMEATRWTLVTAAAGTSPEEAKRALEELCQRYWRPLWRFVKGRFSLTDEDAEDAVQSFICRMLEQGILAHADATRGRFRSFLFKCVEHHCLNELEKRNTQRRGGGAPHIAATLSGDFTRLTDPACQSEEAVTAAADREWALVTMRAALNRVSAHYSRRSRESRFRVLKQLVMSPEASSGYAQAAEDLEMTPAGIAVEVHRFRQRLRDAFSREIRETVNSPEEELEECQYLLRLLE